ncbi:MAG: hypothetical protein V7K25_19615 [Nostoc sp.]|uniref:hypothetical protein n=1 Tax=Nostoc sp. TaxID=1180 RepID=UPI002FFC99D0
MIGITNSGKLDTGEGGDTIIGTGTGGNTLKSANLTFNNNENSISLSTTGFEKFIFADSSFCYSTLANGA